MPGNFKKEDLRKIKTKSSLINSFLGLMTRKKFSNVTVNDICEEAQLSRTAFYGHFQDKFDLLRYYLDSLKPDIIPIRRDYQRLSEYVNNFAKKYTRGIRNLLADFNSETHAIVGDFLAFLLCLDNCNYKICPKGSILKNFCTGGLINYLLWQIDNGFPQDFNLANPHIYSILENLMRWGNITIK